MDKKALVNKKKKAVRRPARKAASRRRFKQHESTVFMGGSSILTDDMIRGGEELLRILDARFYVRAALWILKPDQNTWQLLVAIRELDTLGPRKIYAEIGRVVPSKVDGIGQFDVEVVRAGGPFIDGLAGALRTRGIGRVRVTDCLLNGFYVADALVYRTNGP